MEDIKIFEKGSLGWFREQAKKDGFSNISKWNEWKKQQQNKEKDRKKELTESNKSFVDWIKSHSWSGDKRNIRDWENGKRLPSDISSHFVRQSYDTITKRYGKDFANNWLESIKRKIEINKENEEVNWLKDIEEKYGKDFAGWTKTNKNTVRKCIIGAGFKTERDYSNYCAQKIGFKNKSERSKIQMWDRGVCQPMSENADCSSWLGIAKGERIVGRHVLPILFGGIKEEMPPNFLGYDFVATGDIKIEVKTRCLSQTGNRTPWWNFPIEYNQITDYFLLIGIDNRESLKIIHIWLIHKDEIIKKGKNNEDVLYKRDTFTITNDEYYLSYFSEYDIIDKIKCTKGWEDIERLFVEMP